VSIDKEEVRHVARLARIALTDEEVEELGDDLANIITWVEKIRGVATEDVPRTGHVYPLRNVAMDDEPHESLPRDEVLSPAPEPEEGRFGVPRIVEDEA
jgi:aspartyl-tRNA(Asn)/glutamyl-tRNA(Gln) amidotransferase subunit C